MGDVSAIDMKVRKAVMEADKALRNLAKEVSPTAFDVKLEKLDKAKILSARKKVSAFMGKYSALTQLQGSGAYSKLNPQSQAYVDWMDGVMGQLVKLVAGLDKAAKLAGKDPEKNLKIIVDTSVRRFKEMRKAPQGLGTLVKEIQKDFGPDAKGFSGVSILPTLIMLFMIFEMIAAKIKQRPKLKD